MKEKLEKEEKESLIKQGKIKTFFKNTGKKIKNNCKSFKEKFKRAMKMPKRELFSKIFSSGYFILFLFIVILLKTILFYADTVFYKEGIWLWCIRQTSFFIMLIVSLLLFCRNSKLRFYFGLGIDFLISALLMADEMYYMYASNIISVMQAGNLQYGGEIMAAIPTLLHPRQVLYFIDLILIIIALVLKVVKIEKRKEFLKKPIIVMSCVIIVLCTYYHFIPESLDLVTGFIYNKRSSVRYGTIYGYHIVDIKNALTNNKNIKYEDYDSMNKDYQEFKQKQLEQNPVNEAFTGIAEGKNVMVVQLESVQEFVFDKTINGKEITPNLNKFKKENINITNMNATCYNTTADSEHSTITSLYPMENGEAFSKYYGNVYDDIFTSFKKKGYYTMYAHGNYAYFWNRKNVFNKFPVDHKMFLEDFKDTSELIRTYLADELLYRQTMDEMIAKMKEGKGPIFYDIIAASSHKPYELSGIIDKYSKVSIDVGDLKGTEFGNYLEAVNYADYAFGLLIDRLKQEGVYDDMVLLVHGDHYGMPMYQPDMIEFLGYDKHKYNDADLQHNFTNVLCGMKIPGVNGITLDAPMSKSDVKPTLAHICNLENEFSMGTSIFNRNSYIAVNNGKVLTKDYLYDGTDWFKLEDGSKVDKEKVDPQIKEMLDCYQKQAINELDISNAIMVNNLLKGHIKGLDAE